MGRGLELMIQSMNYLSDTMLIIVGDGDIRIELQKMVQDMKLFDKVVFPGKLPPGALHKITSNCDFGDHHGGGPWAELQNGFTQ